MGLATRVWILLASIQFSSDQAIPGLMARHILTSGELPVFYWGRDYVGATESYLIAGLFRLFRFWPWLVFVPALIASLALSPLTWSLGNRLGMWHSGMVTTGR